MKIFSTPIEGLVTLIPNRFSDSRGFFEEVFRQNILEEAIGKTISLVQENRSFSLYKNTIRGLHFQTPPKVQGKLVRCVKGRLLDVTVDLRSTSETYGNWHSIELNEFDGHQLWIPEGCAHGFRTLEPNTEILYKCSEYYSPEHDTALAWNDPDLSIIWGEDLINPVLSDKDKNALSFRELESNTKN